jgi:uncharacterized protein
MRTSHTFLPAHQPLLLAKATGLANYLKTLSPVQLAKNMHISASLADKTYKTLAAWSTDPSRQSPAIDSFVGDIYSGLQVNTLDGDDRQYADSVLRIFSGLYGVLRPLDGICPYRLEMGYKLPDAPYNNLYHFWGEQIAASLPAKEPIINVSSVEYSKVVTPFIPEERFITPRFLTVNPRTNQPEFVVVHAKIARGAFAHWLIKKRVTDPKDLSGFDEIGYAYQPVLSSAAEPVFVCQEFGGKGLSMRLKP